MEDLDGGSHVHDVSSSRSKAWLAYVSCISIVLDAAGARDCPLDGVRGREQEDGTAPASERSIPGHSSRG